jgi:hypothetical protein
MNKIPSDKLRLIIQDAYTLMRHDADYTLARSLYDFQVARNFKFSNYLDVTYDGVKSKQKLLENDMLANRIFARALRQSFRQHGYELKKDNAVNTLAFLCSALRVRKKAVKPKRRGGVK